MRYMLLIYTQEAAPRTPEEFQAGMAGHRALMEETRNRGILLGADPLKPTSTATTVRVRDGKPLITDGPFAETKEQLAGYYMLECKDLDEAINYASKIPLFCAGGNVGGVEVRPVMEFAEIQKQFESMLSEQHA